MAVGTPVTRQDIDETMTQLALTAREFFARVENAKKWSARTPQATLEAAPYSYSTDEAYLVKAVIDYLDAYRLQFAGGAPPSGAHDLMTDLAQFTGLATA